MFDFKQRMSRRCFLRHIRNYALLYTLLNYVQITANRNRVLATSSSVPYGTGSYGALSYGLPGQSDDPTPLPSDSQIYLPLVAKE